MNRGGNQDQKIVESLSRNLQGILENATGIVSLKPSARGCVGLMLLS